MVTVTCIKYDVPLTSLAALNGLKKVEHQCATPESALQVARDQLAVSEDLMSRGLLYGYSISIGRNKGA